MTCNLEDTPTAFPITKLNDIFGELKTDELFY